jgi:hypothetical protein
MTGRDAAATRPGASASPWWARALFPALPAERLATLRVLVGGYALVYAAARAPHFAAGLRYDASHFAPVGLLHAWEAPPSPAFVVGAIALCLLSGAAFVAGALYRASGPLFAASFLFCTSYACSWGKVLHTDNLVALHLVVLAAGPSADALSVDARRRARRGRPPGAAAPAYGWPVRLLCAVTVLAYFVAGAAKLRAGGLEWVDGENLRNYVAMDNVRKLELGSVHSPLGALLVGQPWLFTPLSVVSFAVELLAPLVLLRRRAAWAWCLLAWGFHAGVLALMAIAFVYPLSGVAFASFFEVERLASWARLRLGRRGGAPGAEAATVSRPG